MLNFASFYRYHVVEGLTSDSVSLCTPPYTVFNQRKAASMKLTFSSDGKGVDFHSTLQWRTFRSFVGALLAALATIDLMHILLDKGMLKYHHLTYPTHFYKKERSGL